MTAGGRSREEEVLLARRESLERLGDRAFAISLREALGVDEPTPRLDAPRTVRVAPPDRREEETVTVAGRVVLKRDMGKLKFVTLRDGSGDIQLVVQPDGAGRGELRAPGRGGPRGHHRRHRTGGHHPSRRAVDLRRTLGDADEIAPAAAGEVARSQGPRSPAAPALPAPDRGRDAAPLPRSARAALLRALREVLASAGVRRVRGPDAADGGGRRQRPPVHDVPRGPRHRDRSSGSRSSSTSSGCSWGGSSGCTSSGATSGTRASTAITTRSSRCSRPIRRTATTRP